MPAGSVGRATRGHKRAACIFARETAGVLATRARSAPQCSPSSRTLGAPTLPIRELLPPVLRGDLAADLAPATRAHLAAVAHEAQTEKALSFLRDECAARLKQPDPPRAVEYLLAAACALN